MPESLPEDLVELRDRAVALANGPLSELKARGTEDELDRRRLRAEVTALSLAADLHGLTGSTEDGRPAAPALALVVVREALAAADVIDLPGLFAPGPGLLTGVDEPLRSAYLLPLLAGELQSAFGFTEPDGAPHPTRAVERADPNGDVLVIDGQKSYVTGGGDADFINTLVEVDGVGPAMVIIDTDRPGVSMTRRFESLDGSHHAAFEFDNVEVPRTNMIGPAGKGLSRAVEQVNGVRMAIAANCVGLSLFVVDHVEAYLRRPGRGGGLIGDGERHRLRFGQMRIEAFAARSALYRTARLVDVASDRGDRRGGGKAVVNEIMMAKYLATETVGRTVDAAIQLVGGQALVDGHPLVSIHRRVRALRLAEGASDVLALNIARGRLDLDTGQL